MKKDSKQPTDTDLTDEVQLKLGICDQLLEIALKEGLDTGPEADALIRAARRYIADIATLLPRK